MANALGIPHVEVAVALILDQDDKVLWIWNGKWAAFWLPMTKVRARMTAAPPKAAGANPAPPDPISPTVFQILSALDYVPWIDPT